MPDLLASVLPETDTGLRVPPGHATVHLADQSLQLERRPPPGRKAPALDGHPTVLTPHMPAGTECDRADRLRCAYLGDLDAPGPARYPHHAATPQLKTTGESLRMTAC